MKVPCATTMLWLDDPSDEIQGITFRKENCQYDIEASSNSSAMKFTSGFVTAAVLTLKFGMDI